ncbi:hypothetical protein DM860_006096 [Cuscuta australis]|uniref:Late embryogenesis abundant protein LEA-2 subgroup domain-containing protein n=1 Tax=Cuscuta australis TaxID=267555 RepID=A0A328DJH9_9ASTE|nr:hypothetical protein DM860_006096 [Cuscuta australis]
MSEDRVYPLDSPPSSETSGRFDQPPPLPAKPTPPPGTYIIQVPKEQVFRHPPPENARHSNSPRRRRRRCVRLRVALCLLTALLAALALAAGVLYLVFRPESPSYAVSAVAIKGLNLTSASPVSPEFDVTIRAENRNDKMGIYYRRGSSATVSHSGVDIGNGELPVLFQPSRNVTDFRVELKGSGIMLGSAVRSSLIRQQRQGQARFKVNVRAPVKIKIGAVKTWVITVKVHCDVTVNALNEKPKLLSKDCNSSVKLFW